MQFKIKQFLDVCNPGINCKMQTPNLSLESSELSHTYIQWREVIVYIESASLSIRNCGVFQKYICKIIIDEAKPLK